MAFSAVGATETSVERVAGLGEHRLFDVISLAAADHVLRIPLLHIIDGPGLAAVMAVRTAEHVV